MKILLFGGSGQLGYEITKRAYDLHFELFAPVTSEVDITNADQVSFLVERVKPDVVINCAAYTLVDQAEEDREKAFAINATGPENIASVLQGSEVRLFHISTDYVFDGEGTTPYHEDAVTSPVNVYGASKRSGEESILRLLPHTGIIVRTSSLYGLKGPNFVATMLALFSDRDTVKVVDDQRMSPTWAGWLAEVILDLARKDLFQRSQDEVGIPPGVYHACNAGECSWFEFASEIYRLNHEENPTAPPVNVLPTTASAFPRPARRPRYSVLSCERLMQVLGRSPMTWKMALQNYILDRKNLSEGKAV